MNPLQRTARNTYIFYMLLMTIGMTVTSFVYHDVYPSLTMVKVLLPFEIVMTALCAWVIARYYDRTALFGKLHTSALGWMIPLYLALIVAWGAIFLFIRSTTAIRSNGMRSC